MNYNILDLFSGAGGFSKGFDSISGFQTVIGTDYNKEALDTFKLNFPQADIIYGDISTETVKKEIIELSKKRKVNMIIGGPPCQGFSNKGKQLGLDDPRNFLFLEYLDIVKKISPDIFIIENVKAMLTASKGYFLNLIKEKIKELGYNIDYGVLVASDFGVPQKRERAIIIACKSQVLKLPQKKEYKLTTVRDAISDLNYLESGEGFDKALYKYSPQSTYQSLMRKNSDGNLYNHVATTHSHLALSKLKMIPPEKGKEYLPKELIGKQQFKTTWGRLKWDEPSPTIDTRFDTPSNGTNSHPVLNRSITPREAARIQSFPDDFIFTGKKTHITKQIGNAVPPLLASEIALSIKEQLNYPKKNIEPTNKKNQILVENNFKIYNADAYKIFPLLKKENLQINHIITDPPYNISQKNNFQTMQTANRKGLDFGEWDKEFDLYGWIPLYGQLIKKGGSFIIFTSYKFISYIIDTLEKNDFIVKDILKWIKSNPMPRNTNRRYVLDTEFAIWAVKPGDKWVFNKPKNTPYIRSEFRTPVVSGKEKTKHPTQKSKTLLINIIEIHSNSGDIILDPFMGSGTTGVAALESNRKFIGIELSKEYFDIAEKRISKYK